MAKVNKQVQKQVQFHMKLNGLMNECLDYANNAIPLSTPYLNAYDNCIAYKTKTQEIIFFKSVNDFLADENINRHSVGLRESVLYDVNINAERLNRSVESIKSEPIILGADGKDKVQGTLLQCETMIRTGDNQYVYGGFMGRVSH